MFNWITSFLDRPPPHLRDEDYRSSAEWAEAFEPVAEHEGYATALDYAKYKYSLVLTHFESLDRKADDLVKYSGTVSGIVVAAATAMSRVLALSAAPRLAIPSFVCLIAAATIAALARRPTPLVTPGAIREVLGFARDIRITKRDQIDALVAASLHCATVGTRLYIQKKARLLAWATGLFIFGLVLLLPVLLFV